jgi:ribonuclease J
LAQQYKRKIILSGASIKFYIEAAIEASIIESFHYYEEDQTKQLGSNVIIIISGCQGDFYSSFKRYVNDEHSKIKKNKNDLVVFSSKTIPGNEKKISALTNKLAKDNIKIITDKDMLIHASGHPSQEDLNFLYSRLNFDYVIPIHGESFFLNRHAEFIQKKFPKIKTKVIYNYDTLSIGLNGNITVTKQLESSAPLLFTKHLLEIERSDISIRRKIASQGAIFAVISSHQLIDCQLIGLPTDKIELPANYLKTITGLAIQENTKQKNILESFRIVIRRYFGQYFGEKPIVYVMEN